MLAANFSDPENARTIYLAAGGLVVLAAALVAGTVWWWRSSGVEHPVLGPLELMGTKPFLLADDDERRDIIESGRPFADAPSDDKLVLRESLTDVFPDGVPVGAGAGSSTGPIERPQVARRQAPARTQAQPVASPAFDEFDEFDEFDDALADDLWGATPQPRQQASGPRPPIDPLLRSDDIW